jgi:diaminopimelate epimerase
MSALADRTFTKMNGLGNEIVVVDMRSRAGVITGADARAASRSKAGPYDQLMAIYPPRSPGTDGYVRIYNRDGSEAEACGNGMRCIADLMFAETGKHTLAFETRAGVLDCWKGTTAFTSTVDMGQPRFAWNEIPLAHEVADTARVPIQIEVPGAAALPPFCAVSMGNPHGVFFVEDLNLYDVATIGAVLERHPMFPERANISFAHARSRSHIEVCTWERGAGLTKACGSAACAAAIAAARLGLADRETTVILPGGDLQIHWRERDDHVLMTGPVEYEYQGRFEAELFKRQGQPA